MPSYTVNEFFFDEWNEETCYVLGYLWADCSVYRGERRERYELTISGTREESLQMIKELMEMSYPIVHYGLSAYKIDVGSKALTERLEEIGLTTGKVETLRYPEIPEEMDRHFIRGYFDGKGSWMAEQGRRVIANISGGSLPFIEELRDKLCSLGLSRASIHQYGEGRSSNVIRYYVKDSRRLYHLLYDDAVIYSVEHKERYDRGV